MSVSELTAEQQQKLLHQFDALCDTLGVQNVSNLIDTTLKDFNYEGIDKQQVFDAINGQVSTAISTAFSELSFTLGSLNVQEMAAKIKSQEAK